MKSSVLFLLLAASAAHADLPPRKPAVPAAPESPNNWQSAERAKLLDGVTAIPKLGAPGPVAIYGQFAFPVIAAGADGKAQMALCAAAEYGKGRAIIFGHTGYIDAGSMNADLGKLLENAGDGMDVRVRGQGRKYEPGGAMGRGGR